MLRRGQDDINPHYFLRISKLTAQARCATQEQQRYSSGSTARALQALTFLRESRGTFVFVCVYSVHQEMQS